MIEFIKKTMMMSMGLAFLTKDKVEELTNELVEKGKMSAKESREFFDDLIEKSEESSKKLEQQISEKVNTSLKRTNVATQDDIKELKKELEDLRKLVKKQQG